MATIKSFIAVAFMALATNAFAQNDDWQTGGGASAPRHSYSNQSQDNYSQQNYTGNSSYSQQSYRNNNTYSPYSTTLWNGGYENAPLAIEIGYVNKQWISHWKGQTRRENAFQEEGKRLHGMQIGLRYNPTLPYGLGLRTGLYYELYFSESPAVKEKGWDKFNEHNLYIPAHLSMRIPFSETSSLTLFGGIGFQWAIYGTYRDWGHSYYDYWGSSSYYGPQEYQRYGNGWPRHVNWQAEGGANLRFGAFNVGCTYSYGLTDHKFYNECKTRQDKLAISLGFSY